jgi:hypothetical protein
MTTKKSTGSAADVKRPETTAEPTEITVTPEEPKVPGIDELDEPADGDLHPGGSDQSS